MKQLRKYKDTVHGIEVEATSTNSAWMLIRVYCKDNNLQVPTFDEITLLYSIN
jgi:hypothetical protein